MKMKYAFLVQVPGYWGRGQTVKTAAVNCHKAGGKRMDKAVVSLVIGDDKPEIVGILLQVKSGRTTSTHDVGLSLRLGQLIGV